jgi:hypothetical protein
MMADDVYDVWMEPARNLTDAELSRQEFYRERIGYGLSDGMTLADATKRADALLRDYDEDRNAARSHGDGPGAHDGCADSHA